jgi:urease accessory protein
MPQPTLATTDPVAASPGVAGWRARLELHFAKPDGACTRLVHNRHEGPLRLLKALASGDGRRLEAIIVHPPGGLVGGDDLAIEIALGAAAQVLATTPGAQKWYRGETTATAATRITLAADARLEWLPQPAILFDRSRARQWLAIELDPAATCVGWEVLVRGRQAMGERHASGHIE